MDYRLGRSMGTSDRCRLGDSRRNSSTVLGDSTSCTAFLLEAFRTGLEICWDVSAFVCISVSARVPLIFSAFTIKRDSL
ncbi:hypothetical protein PI125_g21305 [Phytophthora idaei]|nr:hypothetical protein PI125_g21305 [Phytophthora idaei]KAG3132314.1 hypothetical protein PI126_g19697 [Phytophthora idaei]